MVDEAALLAAIAADVDSAAPRLVYADWLQQRGDPRGELAIVQHRHAARPTTMLRQQLHALEARVAKEVRAPGSDVLGAWWLGFVDELTVHKHVLNLSDAVRWLDQVPLRFVRALHVATTHAKAWDLLARWPHRDHVRQFRHGTVQKQVDIARVAELLPGVRDLRLASRALPALSSLAALPLTSLHLDVAEPSLDPLYACAWPIARLAVRFDVPAALDPLRALLRGEHLASVRELELANTPALPVVEALVTSGRIATLERLALDFTQLYGAERARLLTLAPALQHVRLEFPVTGHYRDGRTAKELAALLDDMDRPDAIAAYERTRFEPHDREPYRRYASALHRRGGPITLERVKQLEYPQPFSDGGVAHVARAIAEREPAGSTLWQRCQLALARAYALDARWREVLDLVAPLPVDDSVRLLRVLAGRALGTAITAELDVLAASNDVVMRCLAAVIRGAACEPGRDPDALEIAIYAAYVGNDRARAAALTRVLAAQLTDDERPWNHDLRLVLGVLPTDPKQARTFIDELVRTTRGRFAPDELERLIDVHLT